MPQIAYHIPYMLHALRLAERGLGNTWPNPSVGALIVKDGSIAGRGYTARGGRPHAETIALAEAGELARGATLYVTLEPCVHQGKTPPCAKAIIDAGIKHVVAACTDPNPLVAGKGFEQLRAAGITVTENVCKENAEQLNEGFFSVIKRKRPFVTLKLATSLDGKIATATGESKWITNGSSRRKAHWLRGAHDAIITGIGTVLADNPGLTCRLPGREADSPQRVIVDTNLGIPTKAAALPAWIFTSEKSRETTKDFPGGTKIFPVASENGFLSLQAILETLAEQGITRLLVEAGSTLASAFTKHTFIDRIYWFRAPIVIGDKGLPALTGENMPLAELTRYVLRSAELLGNDVLEIYDCGEY